MTTPSTLLRSALHTAASLSITIALLGWLLPTLTETTWTEILHTITGVGWLNFLGLLTLMMTGLYCYTFTLKASLPGLSHSQALTSNLAGSCISNILPAGGAFGTALNFAMWRSWGFEVTAITSSMLITTVWNILIRAALPVLAALLLLTHSTRLPATIWGGVALGALIGTITVTTGIALIASRRATTTLGTLADTINKHLRPNHHTHFATNALTLRTRIIGLAHDRWHQLTFGVVGFFAVYFLLFTACITLSGVHVSLPIAFAAFAIGRLSTAVPLTPGGLGIAEAGSAAVLIALEADPASTGAGVALFALFSHLLEIPFGAVGLTLWLVTRPRHTPTTTHNHAQRRIARARRKAARATSLTLGNTDEPPSSYPANNRST
ncbi:lysylphosphatidylglycerol synthase domain-containing protein [Dermatophilus congolensis]|uniref:lysylphosphatidylglycerol synthase domain-containing protein n=1 Tax=Dermatophilus congolensis TaxID=1863 RepID=UPI001AAE4272|nr:flippase-like domain-containing protein [Dermatophilus congolensis]MBO3150930.1 flippase-like domain-containing protein [Dermatophilus congolensis]MBO3162066.1 flippase-like domain-containing protein [Dermatophilus congolensis]MBO3162209.1 flippase-like domain-containing protein [Dermatophilus congolensis]MBO3175765.1 flippase-like domain-containing protein [Dermatophilus congolensis]